MFYAINENFLKLYKSNCQCYFESKQHHTVKRIENIENIFSKRIWVQNISDFIWLHNFIKTVRICGTFIMGSFFSKVEKIKFFIDLLGHVQVIITFYFFNIIEYRPIRKVEIDYLYNEAKFSHIIPVILPTLHLIFFHGAVYIHHLLRMVLLLY